jgi:hypothetical protein
MLVATVSRSHVTVLAVRRSLWLAAATAAAVFCVALPATAAGPPLALSRSLTLNGQTIWNLDALVNDTFGDRAPCWDAKEANIFAVAHGGECPSPAARYAPYVFTLLGARDSTFRLVSRSSTPNTGVTTTPIRVNGQYVSCPKPQNPGPGWLVYGGGEFATGLIWCS